MNPYQKAYETLLATQSEPLKTRILEAKGRDLDEKSQTDKDIVIFLKRVIALAEQDDV